MISNTGFGTLIITFALALYGIGAAVYGARGRTSRAQAWVESARLAMCLTFPLLTISSLCLIYLLVTGDFQVQFVYNVSSRSMPLYLKVTSFWGGQAGSLLFWTWLLALFSCSVGLRHWDRDWEFLPWVIVVSLITLVFFVALILFFENPFERFWTTLSGQEMAAVFQPAGALPIFPPDGRGLNPLLRHPGMVIHPPILYLGFVAFIIPFAFAIAALVTGRSDDRWIRITRRWTLIAWLFLSLGLLLGARWAYDVLGWGGYWGWDPVEIAAFMPWLSGTAFLHSVMIQERRGLFKRWNIVLIIITYALVIFGTFLTRSGVLSSVHAFSQSAIGPLFFAFIGITFLVSLSLILYRWNDLRSEGYMTSMLSREALFLVNNLLFMGVLIVCFWGVIFPLISELLTGQKVTVGPPFYERAVGPLFAGLLFLMGIAPLSAWSHSTLKTIGRAVWKPAAVSFVVLAALLLGGMRNPPALVGLWLAAFVIFITLYEYGHGVIVRRRNIGGSFLSAFWSLAGRNRRRYGGYIIHIGVTLMALGIIGIEVFQTETQATLIPGQSITLNNVTVTFRSLSIFDTDDMRNVARAVVSLSKDGRPLGELFPRRDYYYDSEQPITIAAVRSTLAGDLYILLVDWQPISEQGATFKVFSNPLVSWLWIGGLVFILGTLVAAWPEVEK
jgi:cytochrome c-type biogenesis protein CcmF